MTFRAKPPRRRPTSPHDDEARRQRLVTIGFIAVSVLAVVILGATVAYGYYQDHWAPVARVGGTAISVDDWKNRIRVDLYQLDLFQRHLRDEVAAGQLNANTANSYIQSIQSQQSQVPSQAIEELIDNALQAQLAPSLGVTLSEADIDAAIAKSATTSERRHVLVIGIDPLLPVPGTSTTPGATARPTPSATPSPGPTASPTPGGSPAATATPSASASPSPSPSPAPTAATLDQIAQARTRAEQALAKLTASQPFGDVAIQYSTVPSGPSGGDLGRITVDRAPDAALGTALFALPLGGTSGVVEGKDHVMWIGRVTEIQPASTDPRYLDDLALYSVDRASYRAAVAGQVRREKMAAALIAQLTGGPVDQVHAYQILVAPNQNDPTSNDAEAHVLRILYAPNNDAAAAASLPDSDPAWAKAKADAQKAADGLRALSDLTFRQRQFETTAAAASADTTAAAQGGDLGWVTRATLPRASGDAIFQGQHSEGEIIGPVKISSTTQSGYDVIMFLGLRKGAQDRIKAIRSEVTAPGADFAAIARQKSEGSDASSSGDMGWIVKYQLDASVEKILFDLPAGGVSDVITDSAGLHLYFAKEREQRAVDADQVATLKGSAFANWYNQQKLDAAAEIWRDVNLLGQPTG